MTAAAESERREQQRRASLKGAASPLTGRPVSGRTIERLVRQRFRLADVSQIIGDAAALARAGDPAAVSACATLFAAVLLSEAQQGAKD